MSSTNTTPTTATILTSAQATQLIEKLRNSSPGGSSSSIKIQAIQTNPTTGAKQIVAIPLNTAAAAASTHATVGGSPMKVIKVPSKVIASIGSPVITSNNHQTVKLVKIAGTASGANIATAHTYVNTNISKANVVFTTPPSKMSVTTTAVNNVVQPTRKRSDIDFDAFSDSKRRKTEKGGKGLRHFSMKVCEKVQAKGSTSYNEVADELVAELTDPLCSSPTEQQYDQKNIRRRVYDALNVLMAMNIISKEKKEIRWLGLPTNSVQEANSLEMDKAKRIERIKAKTHQLQDLIMQQIAFKNLVERNKEREKSKGIPAPNSAIQLPFIIVNTSKKTVIDCSISNDKMEYLFNFDDTFEIHDDMEVLKRMGLSFGLERGDVSNEDLNKARSMVPRALEQYVTQLAENGPGSCVGMPEVSEPVINRAPSSVGRSPDSDNSDQETDSDVEVN